MLTPSNNPFQHNPEEVLQERLKRARKITREEFLKPATRQKSGEKKVDDKS